MNYSDFSKFLFETGLRGALESARNFDQSILFIDYCRVVDKYDFLKDLAEELLPKTHLHILDGRDPPQTALTGNLATFIHPPANVFYQENWQVGPRSAQETNSSFPELKAHAESFKKLTENDFEFVDRNIINDCIETAFFFTLTSIRLLNPKLIVIWNAFHPLSKAAIQVATECNVPVCYAEYGLLPGTLNIDFAGQMGGSAVLGNAETFNQIEVTQTQHLQARELLHHLKTSGLNRRVQNPSGELGRRIDEAAQGRPKILFAGHNDFSSGVLPYDAEAKNNHSPFFEFSNDAAAFLLDLAVQEDWLLVVKPHPFNLKSSRIQNGPNCLSLGKENINACIDACDLTVTVLSQTNYVSLIRGKAVVMIGQNQLNGSGAVQVARTKDEIGTEIKTALQAGLTDEMGRKWEQHVARLCSSYLYDYFPKASDQTNAQSISALARHFEQSILTGLHLDAFAMPKVSEHSGALNNA